eukprot:11081162-Lingulodinium_polyedra.AAC.1
MRVVAGVRAPRTWGRARCARRFLAFVPWRIWARPSPGWRSCLAFAMSSGLRACLRAFSRRVAVPLRSGRRSP